MSLTNETDVSFISCANNIGLNVPEGSKKTKNWTSSVSFGIGASDVPATTG